MTADDDEPRNHWLDFARSTAGAVLLLAYVIVPALLAKDVPTWPTMVFAFLVVGPYAGQFERVGSAVERILEKTEKLVKTARGFDPRGHDSANRS